MNPHDTNPYASPAIASEPAPFVPSVPPGEPELATLWQRFAGALIDTIIMLPIAIPLGLGIDFALSVAEFEPDSTQYAIAAAVTSVVVGIAIFVAVNGYLLKTRGQTIGKYFMQTQIVSEDGTLLSLTSLIVKRYLPITIIGEFPFLGAIIGLANVLAIFRPSRKCFHDDIAGTKVIQLRR